MLAISDGSPGYTTASWFPWLPWLPTCHVQIECCGNTARREGDVTLVVLSVGGGQAGESQGALLVAVGSVVVALVRFAWCCCTC